jgi:hypothetical protein
MVGTKYRKERGRPYLGFLEGSGQVKSGQVMTRKKRKKELRENQKIKSELRRKNFFF